MPANENHVLAVIDPTSDEQPALERAAQIAAKSGATLELFVCDYDQYLAGERFFDEKSLHQARNNMLDFHRKRLRELADSVASRHRITTRQDVAWDHPLHEGIVRKAISSGARLLVKDTHYHSVFKRSIFSNTDWNLIRNCPCELLLVKHRETAAHPQVIAAVDPLHEHDKPADLDDRILDAAVNYCASIGGTLHICHAFDPAPALAVSADAVTMPLAVPARELIDTLKSTHTRAVHKLVDERGLGRDNLHIHQGPAHEVLLDVADEVHADLVVMGAVSRSALQRLFLGSTAEKLLDRLPCDVLIVKPEGFEPDL
jgi:universal stress protein E